MTPLVRAVLVLSLFAPPAVAEEERGLSLMEEGARLFFKGLMSEMEPALDEMEALARELGPALTDFVDQMGEPLRDLLARVDDWSVYEAPEILPNGDIIIRRKPGAPALPEPGEGGEIDL